MEEKKFNNIGAWIKTSKSGNEYISFQIDGKYYAMFKNTKKEEGSNQPDYNILPPREESENNQF